MDISKQKAAEVVKLYFETHSPVKVIRVMRKGHPSDTKLTKLQVHRLVRRFQQTGSEEDARLKKHCKTSDKQKRGIGCSC